MKIQDCMTSDVRIAAPQETIRDAARAMADYDTGVLPVGEGDRLIGMITDRDIALRGIGEGKGPDCSVRDVMSKEVRYCYSDDSADDVLDNMRDLKVRRLPVLDRDKRLVGMVSLGDLATHGEAKHSGIALSGIARPGGEHRQVI